MPPVSLSTAHNAATIPIIARCLLAAKGNYLQALDFATQTNAPEIVQRILTKTAQGAGTLADPNLSGFGDMGIASTAYLESMRTSSAFLRMLDGGLLRAPLRTRLSFSSFNVVGGHVLEGAAKPVSTFVIDNTVLERKKATAMIVMTRELAAMASAAAQALISRELRNALGDALDVAFLDCIDDTSIATIASDGTTAAFAGSDLKNLLDAVPARVGSKFFFIAAPDVAVAAATLQTDDGAFVFPMMTPLGGELLGIEALVSTGVTAGQMWLIDGSGIMADAESITLDSSQQTTLLLDTTPNMNSTTPTPAQMTSLFQTDSAVLRAHVWFGCERFRADAVAKLTSIAWGPVVST